jgi:hypothetical protein
MENMARRLNYGVAALARELGADAGAISKMMKRGLSVHEIRAKYAARAELKRRGVRLVGKPMSTLPPSLEATAVSKLKDIDCGAGTLAQIKLRKETALTLAIELANEQKVAELVPAAWVRSWCEGTVAKSRAILLRIPTELCDRLAAETDPVQIERLLEAEFRRALQALAEASCSPAGVA